MAKDGTNRGGVRIGAGKKPKSLEEKILDGQATADESARRSSQKKIKPPKKYLSDEQRMGNKLYARQIYKETWEWIVSHGCEDFVTTQLVEDYAQVTARHIQCEEMLSKHGLIGKHPTTEAPMASPFFKMSNEYMKLSSQLWYQIYSAVRDNATKGIIGNEQCETMENLLRRVK